MPVGTNGKAMLLLSGGIDSPVAGFMVAKRGVKIDAVYFHAPPYTSERAKQKVVDLARLVARYSGCTIYLHVINFTEIQLAIYEKCPHDELDDNHAPLYDEDSGGNRKEYGVSRADNRREHRSGGEPDDTVAGCYERGMYSSCIPSMYWSGQAGDRGDFLKR